MQDWITLAVLYPLTYSSIWHQGLLWVNALVWQMPASLSLSQPMALACWSPLWRWLWWRWASQPCSTWCLARYSPALQWRSGAGSCPSSGLEVDLWWIPVWYEWPLQKNPLPPPAPPLKKDTKQKKLYCAQWSRNYSWVAALHFSLMIPPNQQTLCVTPPPTHHHDDPANCSHFIGWLNYLNQLKLTRGQRNVLVHCLPPPVLLLSLSRVFFNI